MAKVSASLAPTVLRGSDNMQGNGRSHAERGNEQNGRIRLYFRMGMNKPPDQAGVGYCDSDDGVRFDTLKIRLLFSDAAIPAMFKLDPCVVKLPSGQVVCYLGAAPSMGQALEPKLIAAWGKKQAVNVEDRATVVTDFEFEQNYPNPFNPSTNIEFRDYSFSAKGGSPPADQGHECRAGASGGEFVSLKVSDVLGREVATLVNEVRPSGVYTVRWDASAFPSGVYYYRLSAGAFMESKKTVLMK